MMLRLVCAAALCSAAAGFAAPRGPVARAATRAGAVTPLRASREAENTAEKEEETGGGGHQVKGFAPPSAEDQAFMDQLKEHQDAAAKLTFAEEVRGLLAYSNGFGVMSTNSASDDGYPGGSVVGFAMEEAGTAIFSFSGMSSHTQDLLKDGRASLTVTAKTFQGAADGRVSLMGDVVKIPEDEKEEAAKTYLKKHEGAYWVQFGDFTWFRLQNIRHVRFVGGFARAGNITPEEYSAAQPDFCGAFAGHMMDHMNDDHSSSLMTMLTNAGFDSVDSAELVGVDRLGLTLKCSRKGQFFKMRMPFSREATDRKDIKDLIIELSQPSA